MLNELELQDFNTQMVFKFNPLNDLKLRDKDKKFSPAEYRLFISYLAIIRKNDISTRKSRIYFDEFIETFELARPNKKYMLDVGANLKAKVVILPSIKYKGGDVITSIFSSIEVAQDESGRWFWELEADEKAMPYLFKYTGNFTKYQLKTFAQLKTLPEMFLYETLKQRLPADDNKVVFEIYISDLQEKLGTSYKEYKEFKRNILDKCKKKFDDLESSEITFDFSPSKKSANTYMSLFFTVYRKNPIIIKEHPDEEDPSDEQDSQPQSSAYIDENGISRIFEPDKDYTEEEVIKYYGNERNAEIAQSTKYEFSKDEIDEIILLMTDINIVPDDEEIRIVGKAMAEWSGKEKYIRRLYSKLQSSVVRYGVKKENRARYFIKMLENDIKEMAKTSTASDKNNPKKETSYDLDEWEEFAENYIHNLIKNKETDSESK